MKTHIIRDGVVFNTILATLEEAQVAFPGGTCIDGSTGGIGWKWDGETLTAPEVGPPSVADQLAAIEAALDAHLDSVAQQYRFADRTRLALRAAYPNPWQALGLAFGTWMDTCNSTAAQGMQDFLDGKIPLQTPEEVIAKLPEFVAP